MQVKSIAIFLTFIKLAFVIKIFVLSIFSGKVGRQIPPPVFTSGTGMENKAHVANNGKYNFLPQNTGKYDFRW